MDDVIEDSELKNHLDGQPELLRGIGEQVSELVDALIKAQAAMPSTMGNRVNMQALSALESLYARLDVVDARRRELDIC